MRFADRFNDVVAQWEQVHGTRMTNRALAFRVTQAGHPVSATYLSQLRSGNRDNPSQALVETVARVLAVEMTRFNDGGPGDPAPGDDLVSSAVEDPALRRLLTTAAGLSASSIELLSDVAAKLRLAEGLAPGTTAQL
ncbi:hypothetical protein [Nocardia mikamii]|uniref:hypothetical protein n=1 Tax=Nocardia mikamii TaxID=508464 RepID=UPI0007A3E55F|nr:hypothetical protein [Nocardia mikamii]